MFLWEVLKTGFNEYRGVIMLIQFNFENFKSFRDEAALDLSATKVTEHEGHVVDIANDKL